jgi:hypothetical protein
MSDTINIGSNYTRLLGLPTSIFTQGFGEVYRAIMSKASGNEGLQVSDKYQPYMDKQIKAQEELQVVSLVSNIERSKHETAMTPLRNLRVA